VFDAEKVGATLMDITPARQTVEAVKRERLADW
jgi:hypothetical protein